jgi:hypothetical protein
LYEAISRFMQNVLQYMLLHANKIIKKMRSILK